MRKILFLLFALFLIATPAYSTLFSDDTMIDPLTKEHVPSHGIISYGTYIYNFPSKYDLVFWPYTAEEWICLNPKNGYAAFNGDFEKLSNKEKKVLKRWLAKNYKRKQMPKSHMDKLLWLEKVYGQRNMDNDFWCHFYRLMVYTCQSDQTKSFEHINEGSNGQKPSQGDRTKCLEYMKKAMQILQTKLEGNPVGLERIETLYLLGEYNRRTGEVEKAKKYFSEAKAVEYKDENGKRKKGNPYIVELISDREKLLRKK